MRVNLKAHILSNAYVLRRNVLFPPSHDTPHLNRIISHADANSNAVVSFLRTKSGPVPAPVGGLADRRQPGCGRAKSGSDVTAGAPRGSEHLQPRTRARRWRPARARPLHPPLLRRARGPARTPAPEQGFR